MELSGLQIFKFLPGAQKAPHTNCKECGCPTCMAFALKLAKGNAKIQRCKYLPDELREKFEHSKKIPQKTVEINGLKIGGENVLYRHEKTFINKPPLAVIVDFAKPDALQKLKRAADFEIQILNESRKVDLIVLKNYNGGKIENAITEEDLSSLPLQIIEDRDFSQTATTLQRIREKAILEKDQNFADPVVVILKGNDFENLCARGAYYICKYANALIFEEFDESLFTTLMILRENIFTDPQKPLKVEPKIYEFNNPDENSLIFLTTNFALTFFAVANELENLDRPSYLIVTPADGMSVLTAWSAEKFTAQMVVKTLKNFNLQDKVKNRKIIIPGLLAHMKKELETEIKSANLDFEIVIGTIDAFAIADFVKDFPTCQ